MAHKRKERAKGATGARLISEGSVHTGRAGSSLLETDALN